MGFFLFKEHESVIKKAFVMNDNIRVMTAEAQGVIKIWKAEDGTTFLSLSGPVNILNLAPNSQFAISGQGDQQ